MSALGSVALQENSANKLEARNISNDDSQYWNMEQYPMPPIFWTTLQNLKSGSFLAQDKKNQSQLIPSTSSRNALDYTIQWCFVPQPNHPFHHFMIVNRATGWVLVGTTQSPSIYAAARDQVQSGHLWAMMPVMESGYSIPRRLVFWTIMRETELKQSHTETQIGQTILCVVGFHSRYDFVLRIPCHWSEI